LLFLGLASSVAYTLVVVDVDGVATVAVVKFVFRLVVEAMKLLRPLRQRHKL